MDVTEKDPRIISSLQRALDILSLFGPQSPELGITDIAKALNLHKSTAFGLVYTLSATAISRRTRTIAVTI